MAIDSTVDPNNFTRLVIALEHWIQTGEILAACLEKTGDTANFQRIRDVQQNVEKIKKTIAQMRG
jgi:hypothetical protein